MDRGRGHTRCCGGGEGDLFDVVLFVYEAFILG